MQHQRDIKDWDPSKGVARQGDVVLFRVPDTIKPSRLERVPETGHKLILQEGEMTGHHHAIFSPALFNDTAMTAEIPEEVRGRLAKFFAKTREEAVKARTGTAVLCLDASAATELQSAGIITRTDLIKGFLFVEGGPVVLRHPEHDGIRIPEGTYYVGRQIESAGAEERLVAD